MPLHSGRTFRLAAPYHQVELPLTTSPGSLRDHNSSLHRRCSITEVWAVIDGHKEMKTELAFRDRGNFVASATVLLGVSTFLAVWLSSLAGGAVGALIASAVTVSRVRRQLPLRSIYHAVFEGSLPGSALDSRHDHTGFMHLNSHSRIFIPVDTILTSDSLQAEYTPKTPPPLRKWQTTTARRNRWLRAADYPG